MENQTGPNPEGQQAIVIAVKQGALNVLELLGHPSVILPAPNSSTKRELFREVCAAYKEVDIPPGELIMTVGLVIAELLDPSERDDCLAAGRAALLLAKGAWHHAAQDVALEAAGLALLAPPTRSCGP